MEPLKLARAGTKVITYCSSSPRWANGRFCTAILAQAMFGYENVEQEYLYLQIGTRTALPDFCFATDTHSVCLLVEHNNLNFRVYHNMLGTGVPQISQSKVQTAQRRSFLTLSDMIQQRNTTLMRSAACDRAQDSVFKFSALERFVLVESAFLPVCYFVLAFFLHRRWAIVLVVSHTEPVNSDATKHNLETHRDK